MALENIDSKSLNGLTSAEAQSRLEKYGPNAIVEKRQNMMVRFLAYFWGPIPWMIEVAAVLSAFVGHWEDFSIIVLMLLINAGVGFIEEQSAEKAIAALKQKLALQARVKRDGRWMDLPAREVVPGDLISVKLGSIVPADAQSVKGEYISIDQSVLTGESLPVDKKIGETLYSGSIVCQGEMEAVVTATGMHTFFGKTAKLVEKAQKRSHFQQAILHIGNYLILITIALVSTILVSAFVRGNNLVDTMLFCLVLTVAAIPVALPAVMNVTMAVGAIVLARMKAIVSRLVSIEEMAGMDVLCADKTGTLTKNQLTLGEPVLFEETDAKEVVRMAALTCDLSSPDAIDNAILKASDPKTFDHVDIVHFTPFDPVHKLAKAEVKDQSAVYTVAKGAPQVILELMDNKSELEEQMHENAEKLASRGYRTLGVARKDSRDRWHYLGLLPLFDPPRDDCESTIEEARKLGLRIIMVTGDHIAIAREIAGKLKLGSHILSSHEVFGRDGEETSRILKADGFSEVFPEHKFDIVTIFQQVDHIVGMTGDGVNDAPALKQADVGIAVSGATDAAKAAADLVLTAPGLSVIASAMLEARCIFERMTSYAVFRIAETVRVLLFMTLSILAMNFYPVTPIMIVLLAILNDVPIMTIAFDNVIVPQNPVRWNMKRVLTISSVLGVLGVFSSFLLFLFIYEYLDMPQSMVQPIIFLKLLVAGHFTIFLTRNTGWFWQRPFPNWRLFVACEATQILGTLAAVYGFLVPPIGWTYALAIWAYSIIWFVFNNAVKVLTYRWLRAA